MARGADNLLPIVVYRKNGEASLDAPEPEDVLVHPKGMKNLEITLTNTTECGCTSKPTDVRFDGGQIIVELSGELTNKLGKGIYRLDLTYDEPNSHYADGMRHIALSKECCNVVDPKDATEPMAAEIRLEVQDMLKGDKGDTGLSAYEWAVEEGLCSTPEQFVEVFRGATGLSAYELYLATTTDSPKMSLPEWQASNKGEKGDSAYQIYLNTTDDEHKLTEKQWANANDFFYQFLFHILKGSGVKPTETDMTADQVYELDKLRRDMAIALRSYRVEVSDNDGLNKMLQIIQEGVVPPVLIYKDDQFYLSPNERFPKMEVAEIKTPTMYCLFQKATKMKAFPEILGVHRTTTINRMCEGASELAGEVILANMPVCTDAAGVFQGCKKLERVVLGDIPKNLTLINLCQGCGSLTYAKIGNSPKCASIQNLFEYCSSLVEVELGDLGKPREANYIFNGCSSLRVVRGVPIDLSEAVAINSVFNSCSSLEEVCVRGIGENINMGWSVKLSADSVRYLVDNAKTVTGKVITLSRSLLVEHEAELTKIGEMATQKGWTINYR